MANNNSQTEESRDITQLDPVTYDSLGFILFTDSSGKTGRAQGAEMERAIMTTGIVGTGLMNRAYTYEEIRAFTGGSSPLVAYAGDFVAAYDLNDTTSTDDGETILVDADSRRYKLTSVIELLNKLLSKLDLFE